ncbi:acyltransferase family protein [Paludibacterium yongneupense]|uniref:acyltransferase family protein n=1 Tax=Paludibacterium yongneupense TaxID=400061 RepID=UPI003D15C3AB
MIVLFHVVGGPLVHRLHLDMGVPLFFTLSGFLFFRIAAGKADPLHYWPFLKNRLLRIYPLVGFLFLADLALMREATALTYFNLFGLNLPGTGEITWSAGDWGYRYLAFNWWTVGVEVVFYLLFPFLFAAYRREGPAFLWRLLALIVVVRVGLYYTFLDEFGWKSLSIRLNYAVIGNLDIFIIGMLAGHYGDPCGGKPGRAASRCALLAYLVFMGTRAGRGARSAGRHAGALPGRSLVRRADRFLLPGVSRRRDEGLEPGTGPWRDDEFLHLSAAWLRQGCAAGRGRQRAIRVAGRGCAGPRARRQSLARGRSALSAGDPGARGPQLPHDRKAVSGPAGALLRAHPQPVRHAAAGSAAPTG